MHLICIRFARPEAQKNIFSFGLKHRETSSAVDDVESLRSGQQCLDHACEYVAQDAAAPPRETSRAEVRAVRPVIALSGAIVPTVDQIDTNNHFAALTCLLWPTRLKTYIDRGSIADSAPLYSLSLIR